MSDGLKDSHAAKIESDSKLQPVDGSKSPAVQLLDPKLTERGSENLRESGEIQIANTDSVDPNQNEFVTAGAEGD